ncbi:prenyltransferase, UbiA family protein [Pleomassaria siparia CBS 279.74]|uniref:Prenyltransferase, UbiA family protein n=1 Tax=Pleomassaria siparia CBS 279.74 TaxID=1314801 RepID=A0A6G1KFU8_9PLEO|nr:prenyltransferase, UbiA family protein [Pleomassaria siparia CBS 279.74]
MGKKKASLNELWGGNHVKGWVSVVPSACVPYIQLTRLYNPAPTMMIYFPHLFGLLYAAITLRTPFPTVLRAAAVLLGGSFFFSNAAHIWDDIVDAPLDALIERTRHRPIPRKAVTLNMACVFMVTQAIGALVFFLWFPSGFQDAVWTLPSILGTAYYPYAKRHTRVPQLVLGFCISWGVFIGASALNVEIISNYRSGWGVDLPLVYVFLGCMLWTIIYDTLYAHLDLQADLQLGVGSTAVLFQGYTKYYLWMGLVLMSASMMAAGIAGSLGAGFFLIAVGGSFVSLGLMIAKVDLEKPESIGWWFSNGFRYTAELVGSGLMLEYFLVTEALW